MSVHLITTELAEGGSSGIGAFLYFYDLSHFRPLHKVTTLSFLIWLWRSSQPVEGWLTTTVPSTEERHERQYKTFYLFFTIAESTS